MSSPDVPVVVEPTRELVRVDDERSHPVVDEPRREVVEYERDGGGVVYVGEPVPTYTGTALIDTTGAQVGQVLMADINGVLRPRPLPPQRGAITHYVTERPTEVPDGVALGEFVQVIDGDGRGEIYRVEEA